MFLLAMCPSGPLAGIGLSQAMWILGSEQLSPCHLLTPWPSSPGAAAQLAQHWAV